MAKDKIVCSVFQGGGVTNTENFQNVTWKQLKKILQAPPQKLSSASEKATGDYFIRGVLKPGTNRNDKNLQKRLHLIILDIDKPVPDHPKPTIKKFHKFLKKRKLQSIVVPSATPGNCRVVILSSPYKKKQSIPITRAIYKEMQDAGLHFKFAGESKVISQPWFTPQVIKGNKILTALSVDEGNVFKFKVPAHEKEDSDTLADGERLAKSNTKHSPMRDFLTALKSGTIHTAALAFAGWRLRTSDLSLPQIKDEMDELIRESCSDESKTERWFSGESESILKHAEEHWEKEREEDESYEGEIFTLKGMKKMKVKKSYTENLGHENFIYPNLIIESSILAVIGEPMAGKTAVFFNVIAPALAKSGKDVFYYDQDSPVGDHKRMRAISEKKGFYWLNPNTNDDTPPFKKLLNGLIASGDDLKKVVIIVDTLKKVLESMIDKNEMSAFMKVLRRFVGCGGTVVLLGHTNKVKPGDKDPSVYEGTADLKSDVDSLLYLKARFEGNITTTWTEVEPSRGAKVRGIYKPICFETNKETRVTVALDKFKRDAVEKPDTLGRKQMSAIIHKEIESCPGMTLSQLIGAVHAVTIGKGWGSNKIGAFINEIVFEDNKKNKYFFKSLQNRKRSYQTRS